MHSSLFPDLIVNGETVPHTVVAAETQNQDAPSGKPGTGPSFFMKTSRSSSIEMVPFSSGLPE